MLAFAAIALASSAGAVNAGHKEVTIIHMGDIHGHLLQRANLRSDTTGRPEGGLARMYTKIKSIRSEEENALLVNTGDTIQGSGEALYSRGQALVTVLDMFGIDAYAAGNWDWVYGKDRFVELFVNAVDKKDPSLKRWGGLAVNAYNDTNGNNIVDAGETLVMPGYRVKTTKDGVKVGFIGCTTSRGPQVVGPWVNAGLAFTDCAAELPGAIAALRGPKGTDVDVVVLLSEIEIGRNIQLAKKIPGIDLILNSDMHEEIHAPIQVTSTDGRTTLIVEEGQDGTMLGQMEMKVENGRMVSWEWKAHRIDSSISEDSAVKAKVASVRAPYTTGFMPNTHVNPFNGTYLTGSLDATVGSTVVGLHRSNFSDEAMPAVVEGTSHDWITDAIRWWAKADLATLRGFRYGTHVKPGPILRNDLFHFVPIGPRVGKASRINMAQLRNQLDNSTLSVFGSDPGVNWVGGWMFAYSGDQLGFTLDPYYVQVNVGTPTQTSRSRAIQAMVSCDRLPPAEQSTCVGSALSVINNTTDGQWNSSWSAPYAVNGVATPRPTVSLNPTGWIFTNGSAARPFLYPVMKVAGYWYAQAPDTINNCPNCLPIGTSSDVNSPEAAYLLPVNMDPATGNAMLDANGNPVYLRDANGTVLRDAKNRPLVDGVPVDLTVVLEKYLAATGAANPVYPRIKLAHPLPGRASFNGVPIMQPLCGTIGKNPADPYVCP